MNTIYKQGAKKRIKIAPCTNFFRLIYVQKHTFVIKKYLFLNLLFLEYRAILIVLEYKFFPTCRLSLYFRAGNKL